MSSGHANEYKSQSTAISSALTITTNTNKRKGNRMDFIVFKSEADNTGRLVELVHNKHCEVYEVIVDGIPVFNCTDYSTAEHEYNMECV